MTRPWLVPPAGLAARETSRLAAPLPRIETERLILRAPAIADWPVLEPIWITERGRFIGGPMNAEDAWLDFNQCVASWLLRGIGWLTITLRGDGSVLGLVGVGQEHGDPEAEIGWMLIEAAEGRGYALEAARALLPLALDVIGAGRLVSYIHRDNAASVRLAEKLGAVCDARPHPLFPEGRVYRHGGAGLTGEVTL